MLGSPTYGTLNGTSWGVFALMCRHYRNARHPSNSPSNVPTLDRSSNIAFINSPGIMYGAPTAIKDALSGGHSPANIHESKPSMPNWEKPSGYRTLNHH